MVNKKSFLSGVLAVGVVILVVALMLNNVLATQSSATGLVNTAPLQVLSEGFDSAFKVPDQNLPWDYWYKMLISEDSQGYWRRENLDQNLDCNIDVCVSRESEGNLKYARFSVNPYEFDVTGDHVSIAQISDQRDSFSYDKPHRWYPTVGHPVVYEVRFRASDNYKTDGSGGAVGNFGFTLFNYADYFSDPNANVERDKSSFTSHTDDFFMIGFSWFDNQTINGVLSGLYGVAADKVGLLPGILLPVRNVNINNWTNLKFMWEVNFLGIQTITYYANNQFVGSYVPPIPMPSLGIFIYNDNERFQLDLASGAIRPTHINPTAPQYIDLDHVDVRQL